MRQQVDLAIAMIHDPVIARIRAIDIQGQRNRERSFRIELIGTIPSDCHHRASVGPAQGAFQPGLTSPTLLVNVLAR